MAKRRGKKKLRPDSFQKFESKMMGQVERAGAASKSILYVVGIVVCLFVGFMFMAETSSRRDDVSSEALAKDILLTTESPQTTHFSIVDRTGMAVANTTTLEGSWGAHIVVRGAGFVLNNEMGDFNWFPNLTDRKGRVGTRPNQIEPGKRMLSSQTPVIAATNGRPVLVTGSPGGSRIISTVLQIMVNVIDHDMNIAQATHSVRVHHQLFPDELRVEHGFSPDSARVLENLGHRVVYRNAMGGTQSILAIDGTVTGSSDPRRPGGRAAGY